MCGRFVSARKRQELLEEFRIERDRVTEPLPADYNVAPTKPVYGVLKRAGRGHSGAAPEKAGRGQPRDRAGRPVDAAGEQAVAGEVASELRVLRWGLVPSWAKEPSIGNRLINARAETVAVKPAFRKAFARRRCLIPADGFYEWVSAEERGRARKQPFYIHPADGGVLAFAGLYELWRDPSYPDDHPDAWLWSTVIITTRAEDEVGQIHDRMPMVIEPARWDDWLDPGNDDATALHALLAPAASGGLVSYPVSTQVNSVRNNGPELIEPVELGPEVHGVPAAGYGGRPGPAEAAAGPGRAGHRYRQQAPAPPTLF